MPAIGLDVNSAILTMGVSESIAGMIMPFDVGGAGIVTNEQPFDISAPYSGAQNFQPFNIGTMMAVTNSQPFNLGEVTYAQNIQPFDIAALAPNPTPGTPQPPPPLSNTTTTTATSPAGSSTITVGSTTGIATGTTIYIGGVGYLVTNVAGLVVTVASPFVTPVPTGTAIGVPTTNTTLSAPASAGDTSVTVVSAAGLSVGGTIAIRSTTGSTEYRVITGIAGNVVSFAIPLGSSYSAGAGVAPPTPFLTGMLVFDKAGNSLGVLNDYTINQPRSYAVRESGSMGFYMPRNSPEIGLIASDRLIAVTNEVGLPMWAGAITTQDWSGSTGNIHVEDAFALLAGVPIKLVVEILDDTPAVGIYQMVVDLVNARRGLDSEILWKTDLQGTNLFLGDFDFEGDPIDALEEIADRSGTEYAWSAAVASGKLELTLQVRDYFEAPAGMDLTDDEVTGNVAASPSYQIDPTTIINGIRITGDTTVIAGYTEDWAEWAVHEIEPVVEVYADPGDFRRRIDLDMSVDFSISKRQQRALAQRTQDDVWALYERYLYAMHDIMGRPNYEGYWYEGPTEEIEPILTKDKWHTHVELALFRGSRPAAIVMKSWVSDAWVAVTYNITFNEKSVDIFGFDSVFALQIANASMDAGTYHIYEESGGSAQPYVSALTPSGTYTLASDEVWKVDLASITARLADGTTVSLRGIRSPAEFRGRYLDLSEPGISVTATSPVSNISDAGSLVGKVWAIERPRIRDWDPRRDGTGALLNKQTVYSGQLTTRPRWHFVPYSTGETAETRLADGMFVTDVENSAGPDSLADTMYVESVSGFPVGNFPFDILVGDPLFAQEVMTVTGAFGNKWIVKRGQTAEPVETTADVSPGATVIPVADSSLFLTGMLVIIGGETITIDEVNVGNIVASTPLTQAHAAGTTVATNGLVFTHPAGTMVRLLGGTPFDGFVYPYTWPEGELYAANLLERLRKPTRLVSINVTNENDDWATFSFGSTHTVNILTEGPPGGVQGTVRVVGMSPDEDSGIMELVLELLDA